MAPDSPISMAPAPASRPVPRPHGRTDPQATDLDGADFGRLVARDWTGEAPVEGEARALAEGRTLIKGTQEETTPEDAAAMPDVVAEVSVPAEVEPDWLEALLAEVETVTRSKAEAPELLPAASVATVTAPVAATAAPASMTALPLTVALEKPPSVESGGETVTDPVADKGLRVGPVTTSASAGRTPAGPGGISDELGKPEPIQALIGTIPATVTQQPAEGGEAEPKMAPAQPHAPAPTAGIAEPMPATRQDAVATDPTALRSAPVVTPEPPAPAPAVAAAIATPAIVSADGSFREMPPLPVPLPRLRAELAREVKALVQQGRAEMETRRQKDGSLTTEMELSPAELGRLRIILHSGERGLHVSVLVDRPESLEAVRRHLEGFHRALMADGVTLDDVDIGAGGRDDHRPDPRTAQRAERMLPPDDALALPPSPSPLNAPPSVGRLDIRL